MEITKEHFCPISKNKFEQFGHFMANFPLSDTIKNCVLEENWPLLDEEFHKLTANDGALFQKLQNYGDFSDIEFIISIRDAKNEWEEDGIWHDDGSRFFAFSLSLTINSNEVEGGVLEIRKKGEIKSYKIPPFEFGQMVVFKTGVSGFEHKINQVTKGRRIIIAGWCS